MDIEVMENAKLRHRAEKAEAEVARIEGVLHAAKVADERLADENERLQAAMNEQEAVAALTKVLIEFHEAGEASRGEIARLRAVIEGLDAKYLDQKAENAHLRLQADFLRAQRDQERERADRLKDHMLATKDVS